MSDNTNEYVWPSEEEQAAHMTKIQQEQKEAHERNDLQMRQDEEANTTRLYQALPWHKKVTRKQRAQHGK